MLFNAIKLIIRISFVLICFGCGTAKAGLQSELQNMFNGMVNVTDPNAYIAQGRGVISGGSVDMRFRQTNPNLATFVPPSLKAGCGGIDMVAGSLSFISLDQFIQLAKNIAQNAAGYAFGLAIEGLCPTCAQEVKWLQKQVADLNKMIVNSCDAAKDLVENKTGIGAWIRSKKADSDNAAVQSGAVADSGAALTSANSGGPLANADSTTVKSLTGNVVWNALQTANVGAWYSSGGGDDLLRILMSVTGTVVFTDTADKDSAQQITPNKFPPVIGFNAILYGLHSDPKNAPYICGDNSTDCLVVNKQPLDFIGMRQIVQGMLFGASYQTTLPTDLGTGIVSKINGRGGAAAFSPAEQAFISSSKPGILAMLRDVSTDSAAMKSLAMDITEVIAIETTASFVLQGIDAVETALLTKWTPNSEAMLADLDKARNQVHADLTRSHQIIASIRDKQEVAKFAAERLYRTNASNVRGFVAAAR